MELKPGLWVDVEFREEGGQQRARRVMVMRPVGGPDTSPEKERRLHQEHGPGPLSQPEMPGIAPPLVRGAGVFLGSVLDLVSPSPGPLAQGDTSMANDSDPFLAERRPGESSTQPPVAERSPARALQGPETRPAGGLGIVLGSGALAFLLGGAVPGRISITCDPAMAGRRPEARQAQGQEPGAGPSTTDLASRVDDLSGKLERLQTDVDHVTKAAAPPDLEPLNQRISALEDLATQVPGPGCAGELAAHEDRRRGSQDHDTDGRHGGVRDQVTSLAPSSPRRVSARRRPGMRSSPAAGRQVRSGLRPRRPARPPARSRPRSARRSSPASSSSSKRNMIRPASSSTA